MTHTQDYLNELKKEFKAIKEYDCTCGMWDNDLKKNFFCICDVCKARIEACEKLIEAIQLDIKKVTDDNNKIWLYDVKEILRGEA